LATSPGNAANPVNANCVSKNNAIRASSSRVL
jgi:hypothetical protein